MIEKIVFQYNIDKKEHPHLLKVIAESDYLKTRKTVALAKRAVRTDKPETYDDWFFSDAASLTMHPDREFGMRVSIEAFAKALSVRDFPYWEDGPFGTPRSLARAIKEHQPRKQRLAQYQAELAAEFG